MVYSTITESIEASKSDEVSHDKLYLKTISKINDNTVVFNYNSIILKYYDYLQKFIHTVELTNEELEVYRYKPKLFCSTFYDSAELWGGLLLINNMISVVEFSKRTIKAFPGNIYEILDEIILLEDTNIKENIEYLEKTLKK